MTTSLPEPLLDLSDAEQAGLFEAFTDVGVALALWDEHDRLVRFNRRFAELIPALAREAKPGIAFEALVRRAVAGGAVASALSDPESWIAERLAAHRRPGAPGEIETAPGLWLRVAETRLGNGYTLECWTDISELKSLNEQVRQSEERTRGLIELVPAAVFVHAAGRVVFVNRTGARRFGAEDAQALAGRPLESLLDEASCDLAQAREALDGGRAGCELAFRRLDGAPLWLEVHAAPFRDRGKDYVLVIAADVTPRKLAEQQSEFLAHHDALTGLPNRTLFMDRLADAVAEARREGRKVAVLLLDLDHFRHVNDTLGHGVGDRLLVEVAARLRRCARGADTVVRLGGDEFAIVQTEIDTSEQAAALARRAGAALALPAVIDGRQVHTGASIGITLFPDDAGEVGGLLKNADLALYRAKGLARGGVEFYTAELGESARRRMELAEGLHRALARDEFELHYQPNIRLGDGAVVGGEALLRWNHPDRGLIAPAEFIGHAEASGLILAIGEWALDRTCAQLSAWARKGCLLVPIWVNVSAIQFRDQALLDKVRTTLLGAGVEPRMLGLEITETALMPDVATSTATLDRLVELGVELSIDDFGTGYSSLNYLKRFPVGKLKIDQSFVREITNNPLDSAIARTIIHLGHSLGMHVLAEGVETTGQANLLSDLGCDQIQGRLVSPPLPADEFVRFVARARGVREPRL
jgi:diguanylate cyclase (GGDEF)-like protein/PAS domain S-box-containing protein